MSLRSFFQSVKNVFWFGGVDEDLKKKPLSETQDHDIFFISRDVEDYETRLEGMEDWFEELLDEPIIEINEPAETEPYMVTHIEVTAPEGEFRLIYYENDELIFRGEREIVLEMVDPISEKLDLEFQRV